MATEIKGSQIRDDTVTGDDVDESTLVLNRFFYTTYTANSSSNKVFIRPVDVGQVSWDSVNNRFIVPSDGKIKYVLIRSDGTNGPPGSTEIGFHKASDGDRHLDEDASDTATEIQTINLSTAHTVVKATFSSSATFSANDIIGISVNPTNNHGRVNVTVVFELNPF